MIGLVGLVALLSVIFGSYLLNTNVDNRASAATARKTTESSSSTAGDDYSAPIEATITPYEGGKALLRGDNIVANKTYKISLTMAPVGDWGIDNVIIGVFQTYETLADMRIGDTVPGSLVLHYVGQDKFEGTFKASSLHVGRYILVKPEYLRFTNGGLGLHLSQTKSSYLEGGRVVAK